MKNIGICNHCKDPVPVIHRQEGGREFLDKHCQKCGITSSIASNDSDRYREKRSLMQGAQFSGCSMECLKCHHKNPNLVFVETTNRCNMNCPICITNVPSMGFQFEPRMEYFRRIFEHYRDQTPRPQIQLFGGEPTMREDLVEIITLGKAYGFHVRLVTNGLKFAGADYARRLAETGVTILISFDGFRKEIYGTLRNSLESRDLKTAAVKNLVHHTKDRRLGELVLMTVVDTEVNGEDLRDILEYCRKHAEINGIYFMPLAQVWSPQRMDYEPKRTTIEDVERLVGEAVGTDVEFVPLGAFEFKSLKKFHKPRFVAFAGVHPNCESLAYLVRAGNRYVSWSVFLKDDVASVLKDVRTLDQEMARHVSEPIRVWKRIPLYLSYFRLFLKHANVGKSLSILFNARGLPLFRKAIRIAAKCLFGKNLNAVIQEETAGLQFLQIIILPFIDDDLVESERLRECSACFAYVDPETDAVKSIPFCIWERYKNGILRRTAKRYNKKGFNHGL